MAADPSQSANVAEAVVAPPSRLGIQMVWLVPLVAVLIGGWLAVHAIMEKGPTITISFKTGEGLEAGKTKIKFKNVDVGVIKTVTLSKDHARVIASADVNRDAADLLVAGTRFWIVRPRISGGTVSGLSTLLSGSYVGMDVGTSKDSQREYVGLEVPPVFASDVPGRTFVLKGEDMGSIDTGSPVYFRRLQVGQVTSYKLDDNGRGTTLTVFINEPYDKFVNLSTRFWQASGVDVSLDTNGIRVNTQSLVSILIGGLAFETPLESTDKAEAEPNSIFQLFGDRAEAMRHHDRIVDNYVLNFGTSVRGLTVGAPVDFRGVVVGDVAAIYTQFDPVTKKLSIPVEVHFYPERLTSRLESGGKAGRLADDREALVQTLIDHGFRAQLRTGNLLTGQLYIALDYFPNAPRAKVDWSGMPPEFPTVPGNLQSLQDSIADVVAKLNQIPFEGIGNHAQQTLADADVLMKRLDGEVAPEARNTLVAARSALDSANNALQPDAGAANAMRELARTAAAFRVLADYLERHPEALIRGKQEEKQ